LSPEILKLDPLLEKREKNRENSRKERIKRAMKMKMENVRN